MNIAHDVSIDSTLGHIPVPATPPAAQPRVLHRIAEARRQQGISVRSVARRM